MSALDNNRFVFVFAAACALVACSKRGPERTKASTGSTRHPVAAAAAAAAAAEKPGVSPDGKLDPNDPKHGSRKLMGLDVGVFVDGVQTSVLRYGDLPVMTSETLEGGSVRYRIFDYVKAIGLDPDAIQSLHFHGNNDRIASVEGSELREDKNRFKFQFLSGNTGAPVVRWDTDGLKNDFVVHEIRKVTIYVSKPPAVIHPTKKCHLGADGECSDAVPYAAGDAVKGTRIYVDGKMVGFVKRRQLADALLMDKTDTGEQKYNVARLVAQMGVDMTGIRSFELVAGDDIIARASSDELARLAPDLYFTLPKHNHGKVRVHVPSTIQSKESNTSDRDALISSVHVWKRTKPVDRELSIISEDTDLSVQLASNTASSAHSELGRAGER